MPAQLGTFVIQMVKALRIVFFSLFFVAAAPAFGNTERGKDSAIVTYHENGKIKEEGKYRNGLKHGSWYTYDDKGELIVYARYKKGKLRWEGRYRDGKLIQTTNRRGIVVKMKDCGC